MNQLFTLATSTLLLLVVITADSNVLDAQDKPADKKADDQKKTATVEIKVKPIAIYETLDGVFESTQTHEVTTDFETWSDLKIDTVVAEGTKVAAGQELMKFQTKTIDKALAEAEFAAQTSEFALQNARLEKKEADATYGLDQALAERTWQNAQQDYEYYQKIQLPQRLDDLAYNEKSAGYFLEYSQDELDQLEQMYTEDELTEESEEIVLKRQRRSVESAERNKKRSLERVKRDREISVPREKIAQEDSLKRKELAFQRSEITLPIKKEKAAVALAQAEFSHQNKVRHLKEIRADREMMTLNAPAAGIVYYGRCIRGKWVGARGSTARRLERHKKVTPNAVVMTIVDAGQMMIRANLSEAQLDSLSVGLQGKALIKSAGNKTIPVSIKSVAKIPLDDGKFDCQITAENLPSDPSVMPGMGCKLSFLVHENKQAVIAPTASVFSDDGGISHYVYRMEGDSAKRTDVEIGHKSGDGVEITRGLAAGDKIAKSKP